MTTKTPWGAANVRNGGGLAKHVAPVQDQRLLFAMYDVERATREAAMDNEQLSDDMQKVAASVESLEPEVKELRGSLDKLGKLIEQLTEVVGELVNQKG